MFTNLTTTYRPKSTAEPISGNCIASVFDTISACESSGAFDASMSARWQPIHTSSGPAIMQCR